MNILKIFGKLIAAFLVLLFIVTALTSIFLLTIERQLLSPDFYLDVLEEQNFYDSLPAIAAEQIRYAMGFNPCLENPDNCEGDAPDPGATSGGPPGYFQALSQNDWELLLTGLLPPDWLEEQVQSITGDLFDYLDKGEGELSISISMVEMKEHLGGEEGVRALAGVLSAQPECSNDDILAMARVLEGGDVPGDDFLTCHPPDDFIETYTPHIEVIFRRSLEEVPDEIDLAQNLFADDGSGDEGVSTISLLGTQFTPFMLIKWVRWGIRMSPWFSWAMLLVIAFLAAYSFKALRGWWGFPLLITGLIGFAIALVATPIANWAIDRFLTGRTAMGISPVLMETGIDIAVQMIRTLFARARNLALITAALGLGFVIVQTIAGAIGSGDDTLVD